MSLTQNEARLEEMRKFVEKHKHPENLANYFDANEAIRSTITNELNNSLKMIRYATENGERKADLGVKVSKTTLNKLFSMKYMVREIYDKDPDTLAKTNFRHEVYW